MHGKLFVSWLSVCFFATGLSAEPIHHLQHVKGLQHIGMGMYQGGISQNILISYRTYLMERGFLNVDLSYGFKKEQKTKYENIVLQGDFVYCIASLLGSMVYFNTLAGFYLLMQQHSIKKDKANSFNTALQLMPELSFFLPYQFMIPFAVNIF